MQGNDLSQTGQVTPETDNPQSTSSELYQQRGQSDIQNTNDNVLNGKSNTYLVIPGSGTTIAPTGTINVSKNSVDAPSKYTFPYIISVSLIIVGIVIFSLLIKAARKDNTASQFYTSDDDFELNNEVDNNEKNIVIVETQQAVKIKKKKSAKAKKNSKKRKK